MAAGVAVEVGAEAVGTAEDSEGAVVVAVSGDLAAECPEAVAPAEAGEEKRRVWVMKNC